MNAIQIILVAAALLWIASYLSRLRSPGLTRLVAVVAALSGILLVLFPGLSVRVAQAVGVTRGVDLVIYLSLVAFAFLWLQLATRMRQLEGRITELVRQIALERATGPEGARDQAADDRLPPSSRA